MVKSFYSKEATPEFEFVKLSIPYYYFDKSNGLIGKQVLVMTDITVVVMGGGPAGLAAAYELTRNGTQVIVLEQEDSAGGRVVSEKYHDFVIDTGAAFISSFYRNTIHFLKELELDQKVTPISSSVGLYRNGGIYQVPCSLREALSSPVLSLGSRYKLARSKNWLKEFWARTGCNCEELVSVDDMSLAQHAENYLNREILDYFIYPSLAPFFFWTPENTSRCAFLPGAHTLMGITIYALAGGIGQLTNAMAQKLHVVTKAKVTAVKNNGGKWLVEYHHRGKNITLSTLAMVCALPAPIAAHVICQAWPYGQEWLSAFSYSANVTVALGLRDKVKLPWYGVVFSRKDFPRLAAIAMNSRKAPGLAPKGKELLIIYPSGPASKRYLNMEGESVVAELLHELEKALGRQVSHLIEFARTYRRVLAQPENPVGHFRRLSQWGRDINEPPGLFLAGDYLHMPNLEGAISSGLMAAEKVKTFLT